MPDGANKEIRRDTSGPIEVVVYEAHECEPIDIEAWVDMYITALLQDEGILPVATPPVPPLR